MSMILDPSFPSQPYVYVYYRFDLSLVFAPRLAYLPGAHVALLGVAPSGSAASRTATTWADLRHEGHWPVKVRH